jgi:hypothetical protein
MHTVQLNKLRFPEVIFNDLLFQGTGDRGQGTDEQMNVQPIKY